VWMVFFMARFLDASLLIIVTVKVAPATHEPPLTRLRERGVKETVMAFIIRGA